MESGIWDSPGHGVTSVSGTLCELVASGLLGVRNDSLLRPMSVLPEMLERMTEHTSAWVVKSLRPVSDMIAVGELLIVVV